MDNFNFKVTSERLNAFLQQISENNINKLINKFSENGLDFKIFESEVLTEIKWRQFIYQKYSNKIKIDESTIDIEVKNILKSNLNKNEELNLSEIVIYQNENKSNNEMIEKIMQEIKKMVLKIQRLNIVFQFLLQKKVGWGGLIKKYCLKKFEM